MLKDSTYKQKFAMLKNWMPSIIDNVKKDLKGDHLKKDWTFVKNYFPSKNINKLTTEELAEAYHNAIMQEENGDNIGEFIANRWLVKNSELYQYFEAELSKINPDFNEIAEISKEQAAPLMTNSVRQFGAFRTYVFCVLNSVVFPKQIFDELEKLAKDEIRVHEEEEKVEMEKSSIDSLHRSYEQQLARITDKYEKRLQGLQKKYLIDMEALKKQIASLQRKLNTP